MSGPTTDLLTGMAQLINGASLGVWDTSRTWTETDTAWAVLIRDVPEVPSKVIALSPYTVSDDARLTDDVVAVQMRLRGDQNQASVIDMNDALFDLFQGRHDTTINGVPVVLLWRQSSMPGPRDKNQRCQHSSNWYVRTAVQTQFRED